MQTVILNGFLGEKYGTHWKMEASTYKDIISCISSNYPSFYKDLVDIYTSGADIDIQVGGNLIVDEQELFHPLTKETIIITPIPAGSKSGTAKVIVGTILIVSSFFVPGATAALAAINAGLPAFLATATATLGINLAIVGLQQMLAPDPSVDDDNKDYLFAAPSNTVVAKNCVPVLCGELIIGGLVISAGVIGINQSTEATFVDPTDTTGLPRFITGATSITTFAPGLTTGGISVLIGQEIQDLRIGPVVN